MLIDWFTVLAQTLNFLILVWLLKRYLYQPILDAIDAREQRIANELADAAKKQQQAVQQRDEFQQKNSDFDQQRDAMVQQATAEAATERQRLLTEAHADADELSRKRQQALQREQQQLEQELSKITQVQVIDIARKTLADLANQKLESAVVTVFIQQLQQLQDEAKSSFKHSIEAAEHKVLVRTAFELQDAERASIQHAVDQCFATNVHLSFATSEQAIAGIELSAEGQLIAWTVQSYLGALEKRIAETIAKAAPVSAAKQESAS